MLAQTLQEKLEAISLGARTRKQRLREKRRQAGWRAFEVWLDPAGQTLLAALRHPGESLDSLVHRALTTLHAGLLSVPDPVPSHVPGHVPSPTPDIVPGDYAHRKAAILGRIQTMRAEGRSFGVIAAALNAEGIPTLSGRGRWAKGTVGNLALEADRSMTEEA